MNTPALLRTLLCAALAAASTLAVAVSPTPAARAEIDQLFVRLEASGCQFNRNGSWYGAKAASDHLHQKVETLLDKGLIASADDFIERAASRSSITGQAYQVRCGTAPAVDSGAWFRAELQRARAASQPR